MNRRSLLFLFGALVVAVKARVALAFHRDVANGPWDDGVWVRWHRGETRRMQ